MQTLLSHPAVKKPGNGLSNTCTPREICAEKCDCRTHKSLAACMCSTTRCQASSPPGGIEGFAFRMVLFSYTIVSRLPNPPVNRSARSARMNQSGTAQANIVAQGKGILSLTESRLNDVEKYSES